MINYLQRLNYYLKNLILTVKLYCIIKFIQYHKTNEQ